MKYFILFTYFLFYLPITQVIAQNTGVIVYEQIDIYNQKTLCSLFFSNEKSIYVSNRGTKSKITKLANGDILDFNDKQKMLMQLSESNNKIFPYFIDEEGDIIYMNWKNDSLIFREVLKQDPIIVTEPNLPKIDWKITSETKKIGRFSCLKASATFRGRTYIAWFTTEIPIPTGPWKLHGLPGLILEAQDEKAEYKYLFQSIEIPLKNEGELSKMPVIGDKITIADYTNVLKQKEEEHVRRVLSKASARGMSLSMLPDQKIKQELNFDK